MDRDGRAIAGRLPDCLHEHPICRHGHPDCLRERLEDRAGGSFAPVTGRVAATLVVMAATRPVFTGAFCGAPRWSDATTVSSLPNATFTVEASAIENAVAPGDASVVIDKTGTQTEGKPRILAKIDR